MSDPRLERAERKSATTRKALIVVVSVLAVVLLASLAMLVWQLYVAPQKQAQAGLDGAIASRGAITAVNTDMVTFDGQSLDRANVDQKGLAEGSELTSSPAFIFTNGKDNDDRKVLHFYFDFSEQRSRDSLIMNSLVLKSMVESGFIELQLHPLFDGRAYSMYAAEALSEVFATQPDLGWDSLMLLLRNGPSLASMDSNDELVKTIANQLKNSGVTEVDEESLKNGTFASWLLSIGNDPALNSATAPKLPYIMVDDRHLSIEQEKLNDPDAFKRSILEGIGK